MLQDCCAAVLECYGQCIRPELGSTWDSGQQVSLDISTFWFDPLALSFDQTPQQHFFSNQSVLRMSHMGILWRGQNRCLSTRPFICSFEWTNGMPLEWITKICHLIRTSRYIWKVLRTCHHGTSFEQDNNYVSCVEIVCWSKLFPREILPRRN